MKAPQCMSLWEYEMMLWGVGQGEEQGGQRCTLCCQLPNEICYLKQAMRIRHFSNYILPVTVLLGMWNKKGK